MCITHKAVSLILTGSDLSHCSICCGADSCLRWSPSPACMLWTSCNQLYLSGNHAFEGIEAPRQFSVYSLSTTSPRPTLGVSPTSHPAVLQSRRQCHRQRCCSLNSAQTSHAPDRDTPTWYHVRRTSHRPAQSFSGRTSAF